MRDSIAKVVHLFVSSPSLNDDEVFERLVAEGVERKLAASLLAFIPMVYVRIMLEKSKVHFPDYYEQELLTGERETRPLSSEAVWGQLYNFARSQITQGISSQDLLNIAGRSAEFDAINQALNQGYELEDGVLGPCVVPWRE